MSSGLVMVRCAAPLDWATRDFSDEIGLISEGALEAAYDLNLIQTSTGTGPPHTSSAGGNRSTSTATSTQRPWARPSQRPAVR